MKTIKKLSLLALVMGSLSVSLTSCEALQDAMDIATNSVEAYNSFKGN